METNDRRVIKNVLIKAILRGGLSRTFYFLLTLLSVKPKYYNLAGSDWISGISMMEYAKNNFVKINNYDFLKNIIANIQKRTKKYIKKGLISIKVHTALNNSVNVIVYLNGNLKSRMYVFLQRNIKKILNVTNAYIDIYIDGTFKNDKGLKKFLSSLMCYQDKIKIKINRSLISALDLDLSGFNIKII